MTKKITITFNIEDTYDEAMVRRTLSADACYAALWDITNEVFRPARKHGYSLPGYQELLDAAGDKGVQLVAQLEQRFHEILMEHKIDLDDWS